MSKAENTHIAIRSPDAAVQMYADACDAKDRRIAELEAREWSRVGSMSRRAVMAGIASAAALPIAAAMPANALPFEDDPAIPLAVRAIEAWNDFDAKCRVSSDCEEGLDAAAKEHETALTDWAARRGLVERETGYTRAEQARERASELFGEIRDELVYVCPTTIAGLRAKAHAARVSSDEDLQQQIVFDIGVLFGDLDSNEKPVQS